MSKPFALSKSTKVSSDRIFAPSPSISVLIWLFTALADALGVAAAYFLEEDVRAPEERHLDEAFFRGYQKLEPDAKEQLRKILSTFKKSS